MGVKCAVPAEKSKHEQKASALCEPEMSTTIVGTRAKKASHNDGRGYACNDFRTSYT